MICPKCSLGFLEPRQRPRGHREDCPCGGFVCGRCGHKVLAVYECEACSAKPGSPALCESCLENRAAAGRAWKGPRP